MNRTLVLGAVLAVSLSSGCATTDFPNGEGDLVDRVRAELTTDPMLDTSQITVAERDGEVIIGGFARSLQDVNIINDVVERVEGVTSVRNDVIVQSDG